MLLAERENLSVRLDCVQRQIIGCEGEISQRGRMPAQSHNPIKFDCVQSDFPYGTPSKEHKPNQAYSRRNLSPLQLSSYTDDGRNSSGVKRQAGRGKLHSLLRSPSSH